jgi:serine/threonine-protein kinase
MSSSEARPVAWAADSRPELGKYELIEELGHGGMATVYRARDRRLGREVAVKIIHRHLRENREVSSRFSAEARAVAKLRHPNIVAVFDVSDEEEPERYLVAELVRGITLRKLLEAHGHFPAEIAAALALELAEALAHAHEQGIVHRDVKPENVLVDLSDLHEPPSGTQRRSRVKLTDFGIAKLLDGQGVTSTGQVLGSPAHMAPEQIEGGNVTARSDVFALGVLMYECAVGRLPFDGKNPAQVLRRVLDGAFTPADRARGSVGAGLSAVLSKALAHDPEARYASTREFASALRRELESVGFGTPHAELESFLRDAEAYRVVYEDRLISRLIECGQKARQARQPALAAACFNRALAFRPADVELMRQVAALARRERLRRDLARGGVVLGITLGLAGLTYAAVAGVRRLVGEGPARGQVASATPPPSARPPAKPNGSVAVPPNARDVAAPAARPNTPGPAKPRVPQVVPGKRAIKVQIVGGALGGYVLVDRCRLASGQSCELTIGQRYTFQFRPPDSDEACCEAQERTVLVGPQEPAVVTGTVPFRRAIVTASGAPAGSELTCGGFRATTPASLRVELNEPEHRLTCTVIPPVGSGFGSRSEPVTLRPGKTIDVWP